MWSVATVARGFAVAGALSCAAATTQARAQAWPSKPVTFVIAFAPAGPTDIAGRLVAERLQQIWGQTTIVENRGGAGGSIGARQVAKAEPNGYTILVNSSAYATTPSLSASAGYTPEVELKTAVIAATGPNMVFGAPTLKVNTLKEVMELAKTEPLTFGSAGVGTTPHLSGERLFREFGKVDVRHTPFTGSGPAFTALLGGHIPLMVASLAGTVDYIQTGKVKGLALTATSRLKFLPNVPTAMELGLGDGEESTWAAIILPAGTPDEIMDKINADVNTALKDQGIVDKLEKVGMFPVGGSRPEATAYVKRETEKWAGVIKKLGLEAK